MTARRGRFDRGPSPAFLRELEAGASAPVLAAWRAVGLDVRIRPGYLTAYESGRAIGRLTYGPRVGVRLEVHRSYLLGTGIQAEAEGSARGAYHRLAIDERGARLYLDALDTLRSNAARHEKKEEQWEAALLGSNAGPPLWLIDRQVQVPEIRSRADIVGLSLDPTPAFVVLEVKRGGDNRTQDVARQLGAYLDILAPGGRLAADVAESYARCCSQLRRLGFDSPAPTRFEPGMEAVGLLVLCRPNPRSKLLDRARTGARELGREFGLVRLTDKRRARIGGRGDWERL